MEAKTNLRETNDRDSLPAGADRTVAQNTAPATQSEAAASRFEESSTGEEEEWLCIWPPDPETIKKFRSAPNSKLDE